MNIKAPKKLIEIALPLDDINVVSAREKSIRHGHPSTSSPGRALGFALAYPNLRAATPSPWTAPTPRPWVCRKMSGEYHHRLFLSGMDWRLSPETHEQIDRDDLFV